ncbi:hypothetical protein, partial [Escherichia coli]|uniref:hypothetical protein n=4 Tax=Escherichia coli TaxID=562 RepID=UPI00193C5702
LFACRESHFSAYLTLWFPLLIWWTPLCLIHQILTRRFRLYAYGDTVGVKKMEYANPELAAGNEPFYYRVW